jgi:hypothetical protein
MNSKYEALSKYLKTIDVNKVELTMSHPPTAKTDRTWWGNTKNIHRVHAKSWMSVGWLVDEVNLTAGKVVFKKAN